MDYLLGGMFYNIVRNIGIFLCIIRVNYLIELVFVICFNYCMIIFFSSKVWFKCDCYWCYICLCF